MTSVGFKSNPGRKRDKNEDSLFVMPKENLYIVADGVGGSNCGEVASGTAVTYMAEYAKEKAFDEIEIDSEISVELYKCLSEANRKIFFMAKENEKMKGMATTLVAAVIKKKKAYVLNIGDSRAYIYRGTDELEQITEDHSYVNSLVKMGVITEDEAKDHKSGHMITRALGTDEIVEPDLFRVDINEGDIIILCTDGLYDEVSNDRIIELINKYETMPELASELVEAANKAGGNDNITVICLRV